MFQAKHAVLPDSTHDEFAREEFCGTMRKFFTETLWPGTRDVYAGTQLPKFESRHGRGPDSVREVKELMEESFYYRASNLLGRCAQELLWDTVGESVERQLLDLRDKAAPKPGQLGSLQLHPEMEIPKYIDSVDIHVMPGNWHTELVEDDVYAGALYDRGVYYFAYGGMGPQNQLLGDLMVKFFKEQFADKHPKRILDMGCGTGFSTLPWKEAFPDAEVYGIDVGAPMLRYAHARAESFGQAIHFSQQNAVKTDFPDGFFDLVSSCLLTHEMPVHLIKDMYKETYRILAKDGVVLGDTITQPDEVAQEFFSSWFNNNVNEPFSTGLRRLNMEEALEDAGFPPEGFYDSGGRPPAYLGGMRRTKAGKSAGGLGYSGSVKLQD